MYPRRVKRLLFASENEVSHRKVSSGLFAYLYFIFKTIMKSSHDDTSHKSNQYFGNFHRLVFFLNSNFRKQSVFVFSSSETTAEYETQIPSQSEHEEKSRLRSLAFFNKPRWYTLSKTLFMFRSRSIASFSAVACRPLTFAMGSSHVRGVPLKDSFFRRNSGLPSTNGPYSLWSEIN